jgi:preprotein translocase SecE subunit
MESQFQKYVNISYLVVAALIYYIIYEFGTRMVGSFDLEAKVHNVDLILRVAAVAVGGIAWLVLYRHEQANQFMNEVMVELSRVSWPTQKETVSATFIVIIMVLVSSMVLGLLDYVWTDLIKMVL